MSPPSVLRRGASGKSPRFLLAFPPMQFAPDEMVRPDGTLALPYLDGALTAAGFHSEILDMAIGPEADGLEETFHRKTALPNGLVRVGMSPERILEAVRDFDVVALTSIFTQQTSRCLEIASLVKGAYPDKILVAGGGNARVLRDHFFAAGFDVVFLSEGEKAIVDFARFLETGRPDLREIKGLALRENGLTVRTGEPAVTTDLDEYPMPSWAKLPLRRYWEIGRIFGGRLGWMEDEPAPRFAAVFTSRGCPFRCSYCHISTEKGGETGDIAALRWHSLARVEREFETLRDLGVRYVLVNDDSFLAKKGRVLDILRMLRRFDFRLADVNGVNVLHLFERRDGRLVVDEELLAALAEAGFRKLSLPFESGSQRLLDQYSTGKWRIADCDIEDLIKKINAAGLVADANFMIGYPDETPDELTETFLLARRAIDAGILQVQFFIVQPFPGSRLFEESLANGQLPADWHWDELGWSKGSPFQRPAVDKAVLKYTWSLVWKLLNREARVAEVTEQLQGTGPIATLRVG